MTGGGPGSSYGDRPTRGADVKFPNMVYFREARRVFGAIVVCVYCTTCASHTAATRQLSNSTSPSPFHGRAT